MIFGGPYSNLQATQAVLLESVKRVSNPVCTGDLVAYCAWPTETVAAFSSANFEVIAGNCEVQLAARANSCGCGFTSDSVCNALSIDWFGFASSSIKIFERKWMASLPDVISFTHSGANYGVIHGGASDVARFFWSSTATEVLEGDWSALEAIIGQVDYILSGHSGIPFIRLLSRGSWINVGVIWMPPNDGFPDMRFILLEQGDFTFHKPSYDFKAPVVDMQTASLTQGYNKSLVSGYWPSEDILPEELRRSFDSG